MRQFFVKLFVGVILSSLLISGCVSDKNNTNFTAQDAITKYKSKYICDFPDKPGVWQTIYRNIGGNGNRSIEMQVQTQIDRDGNDAYVITFNEKWSTLDDPRYQNRPEESYLHHQTKVKVTPNDTTILGESGDTEPSFSG